MEWALTKKVLITPYYESIFMYLLTGMEKVRHHFKGKSSTETAT